MKIKTKINPYRLLFQLIILGIISFMIIRLFADNNYTADFEAYCPFGGILAFSSFLVNDSLACSMTSVQIAMGALLVLAIVLFSKLFCSFICPIGSVSEWIGSLGEKLKVRFSITGYVDILLRGIKYALLYITVYYTVTSSELFCKKFDPYYAAVSGFTSDVVLVWAIISIILVVLGSFFIRLFWCKYLCPLGAVSNIFRFFFIFLGVILLYLFLIYTGYDISFIWPLGLICSISFFIEFYSLKSIFFPLFRITRNTEICTNCKLCSKECPQDIDVASLTVVKHIDCHLCADCIHVCPEKGALSINKKGKKWFPAAVLVVLIIIGIIAGRSFEIPTLNQYWGDKTKENEMQIFTRTGLKSVKCFGSSSVFANQMRSIKGVTGVTTFINTNTVKISYDPADIDTVAIMKAIFTPVKMQVRKPGAEVSSLNSFRLRVDNFLDPLDGTYLQELLKPDKDIYGFTTEFDCPVIITVFSDSSAGLDIKKIKEIVETHKLSLQMLNGQTLSINLKFAVKEIKKEVLPVSVSDYLERMKNE